VVFIASHWMPGSSPDVRVFSNCEEVSLSLEDRLLERRQPDRDRTSMRLAHPPFTFRTSGFSPGRLEAVGFLGGRAVARHVVRTPGAIERLTLGLDLSGRAMEARRRDLLFCHAALRDGQDTVVPDAWENVAFGAIGDAALIGRNPYSSEAGMASILVESRPGRRPTSIHALAIAPGPDGVRILGASLALRGGAPRHELVYTTDGTEPTPSSPRYRGPFGREARVRVGLVVQGRVMVSLDADTPKFRVPASAPPEKRETFHR
jgi:hypothetical protein